MNPISSHFVNLEPKIHETFDNIPVYINSYQVTFHVEQEAFTQPQLLQPTLQNNVSSTTIIPIALAESSPAWMSLKQTIIAKDYFTPAKLSQQNIENLSPSSPENNPAGGELTQNEIDIEVFSPVPLFMKLISKAFLTTVFTLRAQTTTANLR